MNLHLVCTGGEHHRLRGLACGVLEFIGVEEDHSWNLPASPASVLTRVNLKQHTNYRLEDGGELLLKGC